MSDPFAKASATVSSKTSSPANPSASPEESTAAGVSSDDAPTAEAEHTEILPASHWAQVPHIEDSDDGDSAYEDDNASSTASLTASILEYRTVHGRTYHSERGNAQSWNPNDPLHDESMDILHHVSTLMQHGKLFLAPIDDKVKRVLDVGCGTGIWAIDFADQFPGTDVIGVDISPQQPHWIPPNLRFEVDDVTQPWTYEPSSFDYIHMRWLVGAIPDWTSLYREVYTALKPGGYFESKEASSSIQSDDGTVAPGSALDQWGKVFYAAGKKFGRTFAVIEENIQRKAMEEVGFEIIQEVDYKAPFGRWPVDENDKVVGQYNKLAIEQDVEGFLMYLWTKVMGWTKEEIQIYAAHLRRELRSPNIHPYYPMRVVVGRKPTG
ncbi:hypothetical protein M426DRAFT_326256 [Hypoxylon sp. CI-4A]|nr:hypothetical protein M426DRAFT_326256 [Hypoxylon sp. CI-4A]